MDLFDLDTRKASSEISRFKIGTKDWIEFLGTDSDEFRTAKNEVFLKVDSGELDRKDVSAYVVAAIVKNWSSEKECTFQNRFDFLKRNPSLCDTIDIEASAKANFTKMLRGNSSATRKPTNGSKNRKSKGKS